VVFAADDGARQRNDDGWSAGESDAAVSAPWTTTFVTHDILLELMAFRIGITTLASMQSQCHGMSNHWQTTTPRSQDSASSVRGATNRRSFADSGEFAGTVRSRKRPSHQIEERSHGCRSCEACSAGCGVRGPGQLDADTRSPSLAHPASVPRMFGNPARKWSRLGSSPWSPRRDLGDRVSVLPRDQD
jgi:hypothetical protein